MQRLKLTLLTIFSIALVAAMLPNGVLSQSGRGRPRNPGRTPPKPPPPPVKVPEATAVVKQEQSGTTSRFALANGMTVIINEQHATPLAAIVAYFKLDRADDSSGIARLLERMMFKGTPTRPGVRIASDTRAIGAISGSNTSLDATSYHIIVQPDKINEALAIQSDMVQNPLLPAGDLSREASIVAAEETAGIIDEDRTSPSSLALTRLYDMAVAENNSASGQQSATVSSITREQLLDFYKANYRPDNLIISVAGDVSTFNTLVEIEKLYGEFTKEKSKPAPNEETKDEPKPTPPPSQKAKPAPPAQEAAPEKKAEPETIIEKPQVEPQEPKLRYGSDRGDITQSIVSVGYRTPGIDAKDRPAIEVLAALIGQGRMSRLRSSLFTAQKVISRAESNYYPFKDDGLLTVQMWADPDLIDKAESAFFREMDRLRRETASEGEMARAKAILEKSFVDRTESFLGRALELARVEAVTGGYDAAIKYRDRIRAVNAEQVRRVAEKYFTLVGTTVHEYEPQSAATRTFNSDSFASTVLAWAPAFSRPVDPKEISEADASQMPLARQGTERSSDDLAARESLKPLDVRDFSTLNGPRAFVREDHTRPKVTVALLFQGGRLIEDSNTSGTTELMLRAMLYGTAKQTHEKVMGELEQLGANVEVVSEPDFFGLTISVLSRNAPRALSIVRDLIEEPAFRDDDVLRARAEQIGLIREARDSSLACARALLNEALFSGHAYSFPARGRADAISKLDAEKLRAWYDQTVKRQFPLVIVVGDTDGSALISGEVASGFRRRDTDDSIKVQTLQASKPAEKAEQRLRRQTVLYVGMPGPKGGSDDLIALDIIKAAMNGAGGRLDAVLSGNAYQATLSSEEYFVTGTIYAQVVTSPEDEHRARAGLNSEFDRLARAGLSDDELTEARMLATVAQTMQLDSQAAHALEYARAVFYKQDAAKVDDPGEGLSKATSADIKRVASQYFKPSAASVGVVRGTQRSAPRSAPKQDSGT